MQKLQAALLKRCLLHALLRLLQYACTLPAVLYFFSKVPIEEFFRQEKPDPKVVEKLRSLGCKEFGIETEADLDEFIRTEVPQFELVRASAGRGVLNFCFFFPPTREFQII